MDFQLHGGSPSSSSSTSSSDLHRHSTNSSFHPLNGRSSDPTHSWWESISKARSRIHLLLPLLPSSAADENPLSSLADTDRPARSLLLSSTAYSSLSAALSSPTSGAAEDPLCHWLYDTYQSSDADLRRVVISYLPIISSVYLHRIHHRTSEHLVSLSGFEAVLLAIYSSETRARNGRPVAVSIPDLSHPSLYHTPRSSVKSSPNSNKHIVGILSPPLEPQMAVKSTKRGCIVGVALDCYHKQISHMPSWSKLDFCKLVAVWAGQSCPCTSEFDQEPGNLFENIQSHDNNNGFDNEIENVDERVKNLDVEDGDSIELGGNEGRIPLPWELLQPILRILGHCLLGTLNVDEVRDAASVAVRCLYARAMHDLVPQAILATRSLAQLDRRAREAAAAASDIADGSDVSTASKVKKPEMVLVSK